MASQCMQHHDQRAWHVQTAPGADEVVWDNLKWVSHFLSPLMVLSSVFRLAGWQERVQIASCLSAVRKALLYCHPHCNSTVRILSHVAAACRHPQL